MQTLLQRGDNIIAECDVCVFGMITEDRVHGELPAEKPTRFITNSWAIAKRLPRKCECPGVGGKPKHGLLLEGRAAAAARYLEGL